jgi:hypothetical protein
MTSTAEYQSAKLVDEPILFLRIVIAKILIKPFEELALPILLALQADAYERSYGLTHAHVNLLSVLLHTARDRRG